MGHEGTARRDRATWPEDEATRPSPGTGSRFGVAASLAAAPAATPVATTARPRGVPALLALVLCALLAAVAYANSLDNDFALDDGHSIQSNPWIRSLVHVPRYFVDAATFSTLRTNVDYRPLLQTSYAVNYAISGYDVRGFRIANLLIHVVVSLSIFLLGRRLLGSRAPFALPGLSPGAGDAASLAAAVLFAVHPVGSGCVNYISARSSGLTAALVLPAVVVYLRALAAPPARGARLVALLLVALAMLTKVEAVSLLPVLVLADLLLDPAKQQASLPRRLLDRATWWRLLPFVIAALVLLALWSSRTGLDDSSTRAGAAMTPWIYLLTQLRAWWYYVGLVAAPLDLVADYPSYPLSRSILEPRVLLALGGWVAVIGLALAAVRRAPALSFLVLCFFLYLLPHSSIVPLAEPVNEHRPYLPLAGVFLLGAAALAAAVWRIAARPATVMSLLVALLVVPLTALTRERNLDWRDAETLWGDTVKKAPDSPRGQMNYGLALMRRGRYADAEARFRDAVRLGPAYALAYTNLGIVLAAQGKDGDARSAFDRAVTLMPASDAPYYWRARFRATRGDRAGAITDLEASAARSAAPYREWAALAVLLRAEGREADAAAYEQRAAAIDAAGLAREQAEIAALLGAAPVASGPSAVAVMNDGVERMRRGELADAERLFRRAIELAPTYDLATTNLAIVQAAQGRLDDARATHASAIALAPSSDSPYYWRGRFLTEQGDLTGAAADFAAAVERSPDSVRALAALAETLTRLGKTDEANALVARASSVDPAAYARERATFATTVRPPG